MACDNDAEKEVNIRRVECLVVQAASTVSQLSHVLGYLLLLPIL